MFVGYKYLLLPILIIGILTTFCFSAFRWYFSIAHNIINIYESLWQIWLPLVLTIATTLLWAYFHPSVKQIFRKDNNFQGVVFIMGILIGAGNALFQNYLTTATGKLTELDSISEIETQPPTRYYRIKNFQVMKSMQSARFTSKITRKKARINSSSFSMTLDVVQPMVADTNSISYQDPYKYWYAFRIQKKVRYNPTPIDRFVMTTNFKKKTKLQVANYNFRNYTYLERLPASGTRTDYLETIDYNFAFVKEETGFDNIIILQPHHDKFEHRNINMTLYLCGILFVLLIMTGHHGDKHAEHFYAYDEEKKRQQQYK